MDNTTAGQINALPQEQSTRVLDVITRGISSPQFGAMVALAAALSLGVGLILWSLKPNLTPVFANLERQDAVQIIETLRADNVPFEIEAKTGLILVPQDQVESIRMKLAASGIPRGSSVGLELLQQEQSLGTSQFMEITRYQHALETELSRTISSMRNIDTARVHLALPKQSVFIRNRARATASVMVKLFAGRTLERGQVNAIVNLVAASIPYLESSQVTVVDQWGKLFSSVDDSGANGETHKQFEYSRQLENLYAKRIEAILTPLIGEGNVRATVTADVDFSTDEQTQEIFEGDPAQIRSEQNQDQTSRNGAALGIPGALTNQPPAAGETGERTNQDKADPVNTSSHTTRNYELDKTITHRRKAPGSIRQISAAVIVDDRKSVDESGKVTRTSLTPAEIEEFTALVREAIGFSQARGDRVVVLNQSFLPPEELSPLEPLPIWEQAWFWNAIKQAVAGLAVLLLILMVVRPAMRNLKSVDKQLASEKEAEALEAKVESDTDHESSAAIDSPSASKTRKLESLQSAHQQDGAGAIESPPEAFGEVLEMARVMAEEDPRRVAKVVRDWVSSDESEGE